MFLWKSGFIWGTAASFTHIKMPQLHSTISCIYIGNFISITHPKVSEATVQGSTQL